MELSFLEVHFAGNPDKVLKLTFLALLGACTWVTFASEDCRRRRGGSRSLRYSRKAPPSSRLLAPAQKLQKIHSSTPEMTRQCGSRFWLLTQIPLAARAPDFRESLQQLGLNVPASPSLFDVLGAFAFAVDRQSEKSGGRTDLGEMAQHAAAESLAAFVGSELPSLFGPTPADVRTAVGKLAAPDHFARLARDFLARLTQRHLEYYLSRSLSDHVGPGRRLSTPDEHVAFRNSLEQHCREASRIVEAFAGGWFSKANFEGKLTPGKAGSFLFVALRKIGRELRRRRAPGG